ncbi:MAG: N-acetyltransferase [Bifidobacterium tibiigranuli]|uniref:N-acetyltransferase n=1 Tax=Bifidobacterium tibiigranuli TaxID=2172043 RepID=UPI0026EE9815|nr:N-acetyltransferase [Bifidobacterium tibiigranuli]MCI1672738.1 N-acetyltransferase [Bifidobacterium tibiigranuli]MCI1712257.1 N-acetyltransferase [Bifidobacterium tibiigranuli]MCI1833255.1 N-acetyltransferase [Bifidobacterium tibiigranuli]
MGSIASSRRFRHATMRDYERIQRIYAYARAVMAANGNPTQWGDSFPRESTVRADIAEGRTMLLIDDGIDDGAEGDGERILAQFALCTGEDPTYRDIDGSWLDNDPYVTIHRIASSGQARHVAYDCIDWVVEHYGNVRADTHPNNKAMQHVFERSGFVRCGLIALLDRDTDKTRIAYQRHN